MEPEGRKLIFTSNRWTLALAATLTVLAAGFGWRVSHPDAQETAEHTAQIVQSTSHQGATEEGITQTFAQEQTEKSYDTDPQR